MLQLQRLDWATDLEVGFHLRKDTKLPRRAVHTRLKEDRVKARAAWAPTSGPAPQTPRVTSCAGLEGPCQPQAP